MAKRPTIADLAKTSGVSVATIDRVLNGRLPVREETARRVYDAANAIGYHAAGLIRQRLLQDLPQYRLGFILQRPNQAFYQAFASEVELAVNAATDFRGTAVVEFLESQVPSEIAAQAEGRCRPLQGHRHGGGRPPDRHRRGGRAEGKGRAGLLAALRFRIGRARKLCRAQQPQGRAHRGMDHRQDVEAARQGRGVRRQPPLSRARDARDRLPQLFSRVCAGVRAGRNHGQSRGEPHRP